MSASTTPISGRLLRYVLTLALVRSGRPLYVDQLVQIVESDGYRLPGRASKTISDALRWEVGRGRVRRVGRGRYVAGHTPTSTLRWMRWVVLAEAVPEATNREHEFERLLEMSRQAMLDRSP